MAQRPHKSVLFLDTGKHHRGRVAEVFFNAVAGRMGLPWRASSKCIAGDLPTAHVTAEDLEAADRVVALQCDEHLPLLREQFPALVAKVEPWQVDDGPETKAQVEREVMGLVARILGGGNRPDVPVPAPAGKATPEPVKKPVTAKVGRETAGRRGRGVTTVFDLPLGEGGLRDLAATLKQRCGTGGTVKDGRIEIQGDQRERIAAELEKLGYRVKRVGG